MEHTAQHSNDTIYATFSIVIILRSIDWSFFRRCRRCDLNGNTLLPFNWFTAIKTIASDLNFETSKCAVTIIVVGSTINAIIKSKTAKCFHQNAKNSECSTTSCQWQIRWFPSTLIFLNQMPIKWNCFVLFSLLFCFHFISLPHSFCLCHSFAWTGLTLSSALVWLSIE